MKTTALLFTALSFALPALAVAEPAGIDAAKENPAANAPIPESGWSDGAFLGPRWWLKNPQNLKSVPDLWLYHGELNYAYSQQRGNVDVTNHRGSADFYLRKGLITSITSLDINNRNTTINLTEKDTAVKESTIRQGFRYAINDNLSGVLGFLRDQNSGKYIDSRKVWYGGLRYHPINTDKHDLMLSLFYAPETETRYMNYKIQDVSRYKNFPPVADYSSDSVYFAERYDWQITDVISFSQNLDYMKFLKDSSYYSLKLDFKLDFKFTKSTSFFVSYVVNYDNNSFVESLDNYLTARANAGLQAGSIDTTDKSMGMGIKFMF